MKALTLTSLTALILTTLPHLNAQRSKKGGGQPHELGAMAQPIGASGIAWYTTWDTAREEAKKSNRPIFFFAAAAQCRSTTGVF